MIGKKYTLDEYKNICNNIHNYKYKYDLITNFKGLNYIYEFICPEHGIFKQQGNSHKKGNGCPKCVGRGLSNDEYIDKVSIIHNYKFNYKLCNYEGSNSIISIICPIHGEFKQKAKVHLSGRGCSKCANNIRSNKEVFTIKSNIIHQNKFNYDKTIYVSCMKKVIITCPKHGDFYQRPNDHLNGYGCPYCNSSKGEKNIAMYLEKNNIKYKRQKTFSECKHISLLKFDFYLPEHNICIEYDGKQHFKINKHWGGEVEFHNIQLRDKIKNDYCISNNIKIYRINYKQNIEEELFTIINQIKKDNQ